MTKKNIAIVTGGDSLESCSSYASAEAVFNELSPLIYNRFIVEIVDWKFRLLMADGMTNQMQASAIFRFDSFSFSILSTGQTLKFDCAFIAIHGAPGESGHLQAYFDIVKVPYTGSGFFSTAICLHKFECIGILKAALSIKTPKHVLLTSIEEVEQIEKVIGFPCILKPNSYGSGIGVAKVYDHLGAIEAFNKIKNIGQAVLVEQFIEGIEISVGMVKTKELTVTLPVAEIVRPLSEKHFNQDKNLYFTNRQNVEKIIPARTPEHVANKLAKITMDIAEVLGCQSFFRADFILNKEHEIYFLEMNTIPGIAPASVFTLQTIKSGMKLSDLYDRIIEDAIGNH